MTDGKGRVTMQVTEADVCYVYEAVLHVTLVDTVHKQLLWHTSHPVDGALQGFPLRVLLQVQYLLVLHTSILDRCGNCTHVLECSVSFHSPCPFTAPLVSAPHPPPPTHPPPPHPSLAPGYGITCVLEDGTLLEKAAANISVVRGTLSPARAQAMSSRGRATIDPAGGQPYSAAALSLVFHAAHPMVPTLRADVRLFQVRLAADCMWWLVQQL